jgi:pimeloyl-ACP methyl ester carboxylesterase
MTKKAANHTKPLKIPRFIILISNFVAFFSKKLVTLFAARLFTTPIKYKVPKRELEMDQNSKQKNFYVPAINKEVHLYEFGESTKKVLLVHGWSGRGTQLCKIADEFIKQGYSTVSFDAPAHGKSPGNTTIMVDFIASILEIDKKFGPFEIVIGHSLGGMSVLNAIKQGLQVQRAVIIGSGDIVRDILDDFVSKLKLKPEISGLLSLHFERKYGEEMDAYSAFHAAKLINIPVLVLHDENDTEVPVKAGIHIHKYLKNGELILTKGLGHRKILGDNQVIKNIINFVKK